MSDLRFAANQLKEPKDKEIRVPQTCDLVASGYYGAQGPVADCNYENLVSRVTPKC